MIGIVILNYNTFEDVVDCVSSIRASTHTEYKIYIVDNMSTDDSFMNLSDEFENRNDVIIISSDKNGGYSYGNNIGIKAAIQDGCDYILISNPDIVYYDSAIDEMKNYLVEHDDVAIVGPSCKSLDAEESQLFRKVYTDKLYTFSRKPLSVFAKIFKSLRTEYDKPDGDDFVFNGMVRGCCFLLSSETFEKIEFFDANVFLYAEEWILAKKITDLGYKCACDFKAKVLHKEATSTNKKGNAFKTYHLYLSEFYYMKVYNKSAYAILFFYYLSNLTVFFLRSIFKKDYRKMMKAFYKASKRLMFGSRSADDAKNKIEG